MSTNKDVGNKNLSLSRSAKVCGENRMESLKSLQIKTFETRIFPFPEVQTFV